MTDNLTPQMNKRNVEARVDELMRKWSIPEYQGVADDIVALFFSLTADTGVDTSAEDECEHREWIQTTQGDACCANPKCDWHDNPPRQEERCQN